MAIIGIILVDGRFCHKKIKGDNVKTNKIKKAVVIVVIVGFFAINLVSVSARIYSNMPPNVPQKPDGPTGGGIIFNRVLVGNSYTYTTVTTDPEGDDVYYKWDWGDGNQSDWDGPWASGMGVEGSYAWAESGVYQVKVMAKDSLGAISGWSQSLNVTVSNRLFNVNTIPMVLGSSEIHLNSVLFKNRLYN